MDLLQASVLRAKFAKHTPSVVHEPPKVVKNGDSGSGVDSEDKTEKVLTPENKPVRESLTGIPAENARFEAIERKLSRLMHMVGIEETGGMTTGPKFLMGADIRRVVCDYFGMTPQELNGPSKHAPLARVRQIAFYLCRKYTMLSLPKIGEIFHRDHTSVLHGADKITSRRSSDETLEGDLDKIEAILKSLLKHRQEAMQAE